jgi:hypothetical protein
MISIEAMQCRTTSRGHDHGRTTPDGSPRTYKRGVLRAITPGPQASDRRKRRLRLDRYGAAMETLRTNLKWWEALLCLVAGAVGGSQGSTGLAVISALAAGIAFGVWRLVQIGGKQLEYVQDQAVREYETD